jgi:lipid-A-disaccharide synthase
MNFHFAKAARVLGIPALQYVAPQLWAWAPWRMKKLRRWVNHVACILPFEEPYFRAHQVNATFVGHPLFDELPPHRTFSGAPLANGRAPIVGLLPGSRKSEAQRNFPPMLAVARKLRERFPGVQFLIPTTPATHPVVERMLESEGIEAFERQNAECTSTQNARSSPFVFARDAFDDMVPRCDLCLTVSGTATLHVAGFGVPMIVVYRANSFTWNAIGRWLVRTRTFALVNLLGKQTTAVAAAAAGGHIVPEFVPWHGSVEPVANLAIEMLADPSKLTEQRERLDHLIRSLDHPGASMNVARLAMEMIKTQGEANKKEGANA